MRSGRRWRLNSWPGQPVEYGLMQRMVELNAGDIARNPAHRTFDRSQAVKFHPDPLSDRGTVAELDLAASKRKVEDAPAGAVRSAVADTDFSRKRPAPRSLRLPLTWAFGRHARAIVLEIGNMFPSSAAAPLDGRSAREQAANRARTDPRALQGDRRPPGGGAILDADGRQRNRPVTCARTMTGPPSR